MPQRHCFVGWDSQSEFNVKFKCDVCGEPLFGESHLDPITVQLHIGDVDATHGKKQRCHKDEGGQLRNKASLVGGKAGHQSLV